MLEEFFNAADQGITVEFDDYFYNEESFAKDIVGFFSHDPHV